MTNAELIAKIKAEIERLRKNNDISEDECAQYEYDVACGYDMALNDALSILSALESEEQTCKGFEEEFRRFIKKEKEEEPDGSLPFYGDYGIYRIARHFAKWGAEHLKK